MFIGTKMALPIMELFSLPEKQRAILTKKKRSRYYSIAIKYENFKSEVNNSFAFSKRFHFDVISKR